MRRVLCILCCLFLWACGGASTGGQTSVSDLTDGEQDVIDASDLGQTSGGSDIEIEDAGPLDTHDEDADTSDTDDVEEEDTKVVCDCDDKNLCTNDLCQPDGSCEYTYKLTPECAPWVKITSPLRAASLTYSNNLVGVAGEAGSKNGPLASLTLNGVAVAQEDNDTFQSNHTSAFGVNTLKAVASDLNGMVRRHSQSYMMSEFYYPTSLGPSIDNLVDKGIVVWLGQEVWDDNDLSDLDDIATLVHMVLEGLDIVSLIPSPLVAEGEGPSVLWCKWEITIKKITYKVDNVDFMPVSGGLKLNAALKDLVVDFKAIAPAFGCPDAIGTATSKNVAIDAEISVSMAPNGPLLVDLKSVEVTVEKPKVDIKEGAASLVDWLINWFSKSLGGYIEKAVESAIDEKLVPMVKGLLTQLSNFEQSFEIPPLPFIEKGITVTVKAAPSQVTFGNTGAILALKISATTGQAFSWLSSPGSIGRGGCLMGKQQNLAMPAAPIAMALHDDLLNQVLFAAWWGGLANINIDPEYISGKKPDLPVQDVVVQVDPWLPPILNSCQDDGTTVMQVGDLRVLITFKFIGGEPAAIEVFASGSFAVSLGAEPGKNGSLNLNLSVDKVLDLEFHLVDVSGAIDGSEDFIESLLQDVVADLIIDAFVGGFMQSFPIPQLDIGGFIPGIKEGTYLNFSPSGLVRQGGYIVVSGKISN